MKILSAYKITYEGNDARIFSQREGKIKNIEFIFDKAQLAELKNKLKKATEVF
jgi:hypothetical protein